MASYKTKSGKEPMTSSPAELSSHPLEVCLDDALLEISAMELLRSRLEYQATILRMQVDASPGSSNSPQDPLRVNVESWVSEVLDWMQAWIDVSGGLAEQATRASLRTVHLQRAVLALASQTGDEHETADLLGAAAHLLQKVPGASVLDPQGRATGGDRVHCGGHSRLLAHPRAQPEEAGPAPVGSSPVVWHKEQTQPSGTQEMKVVMVRHGESINNILSQSMNPLRYTWDTGYVMMKGLYPGKSYVAQDPPLSRRAEKKARNLRRAIFPDDEDVHGIFTNRFPESCTWSLTARPTHFQTVLVSPLRRCIATALQLFGTVCALHRVPWKAAPWAHERLKTESDRGEEGPVLVKFLRSYATHLRVPLDSVPVRTLEESLLALPKGWTLGSHPVPKMAYMLPPSPHKEHGPLDYYPQPESWGVKEGTCKETKQHMRARMTVLKRWLFTLRMPTVGGSKSTTGIVAEQELPTSMRSFLHSQLLHQADSECLERVQRAILVTHSGVMREACALKEKPKNFAFRQGVLRYNAAVDESPRWESSEWFWRDKRFEDSQLPAKMPEAMHGKGRGKGKKVYGLECEEHDSSDATVNSVM